MKFIRPFLSLNLKAILILTMLLSNMLVSTHETIKLHKTISKYERKRIQTENSKSSSSRRNAKKYRSGEELKWRDKFKAFLHGFLAAVVTKALKQIPGTLEQMLATAVDWCFETTMNEYDVISAKIEKESPCNPEIIKEIIGSEYNEIQTKCTQLETARKMDSNEFSSLNVLMGKLSGIFVDNSEFERDYQKFKVEKEALESLSKQWTSKYLEKFKNLKNDKVKTPKPVRKVARTLFKAMDGIIFKKDLCEAVRDCATLGPLDKMKITYGVSLGFLKCAVTAQVKDPLWSGLAKFVEFIFEKIGVGILTTIASGVFPGILLGLLIKFVISNWTTMKKLVDSLLTLKSDDPSTWSAERDLWNSVGRLIAGGIFTLLGARRRKLKKFRKFDHRMY